MTSAQVQPLKLWYDRPATKWVEALPLGNGRLGAMVFGGADEELIQLNESTLYSGGPVQNVINAGAASFLPQVRQALMRDSDYTKAEQLTKKMQGLFTESYMPMGDLIIKHQFGNNTVSNYYRDLDLDNAVSTVRFEVNGIRYKRESFASAPGNVIVIKISADRKKALDLKVSLNSILKHSFQMSENHEIILKGKAPAHVDPSYYNPKGRQHIIYSDTSGCNGMRFQVMLRVVLKGGAISSDSSGISIKQANEAVIYLTAATSFNGYNKCPDSDGKNEGNLASGCLSKAVSSGYGRLLKGHVTDYKHYFDRVKFVLKDSLGGRNPQIVLPSDKRLQSYSNNVYDPYLETLYFQFGRYLLISSSRPGSPPANLQGIWNNELRAPWSSNYTININTQMNYWPAELTNLSEMHSPLFDFLSDLSVTGKRTAKEFYNASGWVANHNSDIWAVSNPVGDLGTGDPVWANWPMGGAWLTRHLWEHYLFTGDKKFLLDTAYPLMKGAAQFMSEWVIEDGHGHLITAPSVSPENKFKDASGKAQGVSVATTMDMSIIYDLFTNVYKAANILEIDKGFADSIISKRARLFPLQIGSKGQLLEWYKEFPETDVEHRHVSHLFGLYPGNQISLEKTPEFFAAAKKTLEIRGDGGTGWSRGWKINWWARLLDGDHAYFLFRQLMRYTDATKLEMHKGGGTYPNFFDAHPPFQIDGNFAGTAGIAEMLIQSHQDVINLLPALPTAWPDGQITGLRARGGFIVDIEWNDNAISNATIFSKQGGRCIVRSSQPLTVKGLNADFKQVGQAYELSFDSEKDSKYYLARR